jgi:hypothetical protein
MNIKITSTQNRLESGKSSRLKLLKIIDSFQGIRYNDIIQLAGFNNGTLSHHLAMLKEFNNKDSKIK